MATLSEQRIEVLLRPYLQAKLPDEFQETVPATQASLSALFGELSLYLDLLLRWNERTNLTAIRDPEEMVERHFGESLFAARVLACRMGGGATVLDIGSGAGFPGLPLQLAWPRLKVTLAESQGKKSAFLREVLRATGAKAEIWSARAQELPAHRRFDAVTMRAVDKPEQAVAEALRRVQPGGYVVQLCGASQAKGEVIPIPGLRSGVVALSRV